MSSNFQLLVDNQPQILQEVDNLMWKHFREEPDPNQWFCGWYNSIGFTIATTDYPTWETVAAKIKTWCQGSWSANGKYKPDVLDRIQYEFLMVVLIYMKSRYHLQSWTSIGR